MQWSGSGARHRCPSEGRWVDGQRGTRAPGVDCSAGGETAPFLWLWGPAWSIILWPPVFPKHVVVVVDWLPERGTTQSAAVRAPEPSHGTTREPTDTSFFKREKELPAQSDTGLAWQRVKGCFSSGVLEVNCVALNEDSFAFLTKLLPPEFVCG